MALNQLKSTCLRVHAERGEGRALREALGDFGRLWETLGGFVEFQLHPYHISEGSGSVLPNVFWVNLRNVFEVCGMPRASLSHLGRIRVNVTWCFCPLGTMHAGCVKDFPALFKYARA